MIFRNLTKSEFQSVKSIYQQGIDTSQATFEQTSKGWDEWDKSYMNSCRLVALMGDKVIGWAALSPVSSRCVYIGRAEVSIYIKDNCRGSGVGSSLLGELIKSSEDNGIWTLESSIFPQNKASLAIHKNNGFNVVGVRKKIGKMNGIWRDLVFMERRSTIVGV